ncbi:MAG: oxidative damage protection protein [Gammaproteobacteria bacterium]|nr:oxidative damage protection protein [Gammaproteobacteria bacterium]
MSRMIFCQVLKKEAEGLDAPTHPGELGVRIYENISREGWAKWLQQATMIINEYGLSTADPRAISVLENHMLGFFFGESQDGGAPASFRPGGKK